MGNMGRAGVERSMVHLKESKLPGRENKSGTGCVGEVGGAR